MFPEEAVEKNDLGRLKHTTKETCEDCGKSKMQLRARKVETVEVEYLYCPKCQYEKSNGRVKVVELLKKQSEQVLKFEEKVVKAQELKNKSRYRRK